MSLIYKTLFEVKLTHEFYVTDGDGSTIFSLSEKEKRDNFLLNQYMNERESINTDVSFQFPESLQEKYAQYNLKLLPTYSGFKIAVRVKQVRPDTSLALLYEPIIHLPDNLDINVVVAKKNNTIDRYTGSRLQVNIPGIYFFSNANVLNPKTVSPSFPFLFLCNNISAFDSNNKSYEQGELASFGSNDIRQNYKTETGDAWSKIAGNLFASENDRLLVPSKFYYYFAETDKVERATFILKDKNGEPVKDTLGNDVEISVENDVPITKALLDFSKFPGIANLLANNNSFHFPGAVFSLSVTGSPNYSRNHSLVFSDTLYNHDLYWGVVNIKAQPANRAFKLIDKRVLSEQTGEQTFLIKQRDALGIWKDAPVFEIPVRSRFTYWRYINEKGKELKLSTDLTGCLTKENAVLVSNTPRAISKNYFKLPKAGSVKPVYVPNPTSFDLNKDAQERLFFDVLVPASDMFPVK